MKRSPIMRRKRYIVLGVEEDNFVAFLRRCRSRVFNFYDTDADAWRGLDSYAWHRPLLDLLALKFRLPFFRCVWFPRDSAVKERIDGGVYMTAFFEIVSASLEGTPLLFAFCAIFILSDYRLPARLRVWNLLFTYSRYELLSIDC